jgi:hypothetical protein
MDGNGIGNGNKEELMPCDVIINIVRRVPFKSLTRFKRASKGLKKLIENPNFRHNTVPTLPTTFP